MSLLSEKRTCNTAVGAGDIETPARLDWTTIESEANEGETCRLLECAATEQVSISVALRRFH